MRMILRALLGGAIAVALLGATPTRVANPMQLMNYLVGTWNCSSNYGGHNSTYTTTYAYALNHAWLRGTNKSTQGASEDDITYANHAWTVVDMEQNGMVSVSQAKDTGLARNTYHEVYPARGLTITFNRVSFTKYMLTFGGTMGGKPASWKDVCTKQS